MKGAKKRKEKFNFKLISVGIFLVLLIIVIFSLGNPKVAKTDEEVAKCIGEKATLYSQLGCPACSTQEQILGENLKDIEVIDCFYEPSKCSDIIATPTWKINGKLYTGVKTFDKLKELTKC